MAEPLFLPEADLYQYTMGPNQVLTYDPNGAPVFSANEADSHFNIAAPAIATILAGNQQFGILDTQTHSEYSSPFVLAQQAKNDRADTYKGIWPESSITIGRGNLADRFSYDPSVSWDHFRVGLCAGGLAISNLNPTNETRVSGTFIFGQGQPDANVRADFTRAVVVDKAHSTNFQPADSEAPAGYYKGHAIIGRNTSTVKDGVYLTTRPMSEAVVVDGESRTLQLATRSILRSVRQLERSGRQVDAYHAGILAKNHARTLMNYDLPAVNALSEPLYQNNGIINLSEYVDRGIGVCRQQCLLAAFLLEELVEHDVLPETTAVSVERNHDIEAHGAHAWTMLDVPNSDDYVVDPAQNFVGTKNRARLENRWRYDIPV